MDDLRWLLFRVWMVKLTSLVCLIGFAGPLAAQPCAEPDTTEGWAQVLLRWQREAGLQWTNDSLRRELLAIAKADQADRVDLGANWNNEAFMRRLVREDSLRSAALERILDRFGLPTRDMVGARGADAAMLIAQHSAWLQPRMLRLAKAAPAGQVSPEAVALMEDRVLVAEGKRQIYGSQFTPRQDGSFAFHPIEDPRGLDERRARMGLMPLRDYVCVMRESGMRIDMSSVPPPER